jgi:opacity protein-like surface antigen
MTKILLLTCLLFLPFLIFSQEKVKKANSDSTGRIYLDASGGLSLPLGSYANTDVKNSGSGFASPGFLAQVNLDWIGKDNYGLGLQYTFQHNALKSSVKNDKLSDMQTGQVIGVGSWTNHYLMAGLVVLKFIHKFYIEGKALFGVVLSSSPIFKTVDPIYKTPSTNIGTGFAYGVQLGAGYAVSPRITVKANIEYILGNPKIHRNYGAQYYVNDTGAIIYTPPLNVETKRTVSALLIKAGIVVKLSK